MERIKLNLLKKQLIILILKFNNKKDILKLIECKNKRLFRIINEIKHNLFCYFKMNPLKLQFKSIFSNIDAYPLINNFAVFKSYTKQIILACPTNGFCLNLICIKTRESIQILAGHYNQIYSIRYYKDYLKNKYLISSSHDKSIKIWDIRKMNCCLSLNSCFNSELIFSSILVNICNNTYIICSACSNEFIKIYDFQGKFIRKIGNKKDSNLFIDIWHNNTNNEHYILNGNDHDVKIYSFHKGNLFKAFKKNWSINSHWSGFISEKIQTTLLIESDNQGIIRVWDIYSGQLIKSFSIKGEIIGILPWNEEYIIITCYKQKDLKILSLKTGTSSKNSIHGPNKLSGSIVKFYDPSLGESLLVGGLDNHIYLWTK